ncbi:MAG TPA: protein kinase [Thermoanaerobaculia bacterium]|nr:protein kinase [Thermoanaerobaculia bacterium]
MSLKPGVRLGSFEVLGPLGAGGMGEVYRALDTNLGREVAIKVLPAAFASDPGRAARFEREGRLLATINHPAIAAIYGAEQFDGVPCIIMELVPGETLSEVLARGPVPIAEALDLARQLAEALEAAHERGVIHRDLKPSNIKVTPQGKVKVLDLGLAKAAEPSSIDDLSRSPTLPLEETRPGVVLGTVEFMSPEQARGREVDKRTDIWAFGCILYEMLTGRRVFTGGSVADVFTAILSSEPDWSALPPATPPRLRELLARCLEKDARRRLRDMGDARAEMELRSAEVPAAEAPIPRGPSRRRALAAGVAVATLLAAIAIVWRLRPPAARPAGGTGYRQLAVLPFRDLTGDDSARLMGLGFVETVSVRLTGLPGVQVITPSAVVAAVDANKEDLVAARALGASVFVAGTFQRQVDRVRITYRVVEVSPEKQIAARALDGSTSNLFSLQDELADGVARDLKLPGARRRLGPSPELDASQQAQYLQAVGLLQRYDRHDAIEGALEILNRLAAARPDSALVQSALGRAKLARFFLTKDRAWADGAIAAADSARSLDPDLPEVDVTVGQVRNATGRAPEAAEAFRRALAANPDDFEALLGLGSALGKTGDNAGAESSLRRAIALQPSSFAAYNQLGAFYARLGRYRDAAEMFQHASRLAPDSYWAWSNLGGVLTMVCDFQPALDAFRRALAIRPNDAVAASNLGVTQLWMGRYDDAAASLELAARANPNDFRIQTNLGDARRAARKGGNPAENYERSLALARDQLRLDAKDAQAHSYAATSLAKLGRRAEADAEMKQALAIDAKDPGILVDAAVVAALSGRREEAIGWLRKAVEAGYCRGIIARQEEFEPFRKTPEFQGIIAAPPKAAGS